MFKKLFFVLILIVGLLLGACGPVGPNMCPSLDTSKFHPHTDQMNSDDVVKALGYLADGSLKFSAWVEKTGEVILSFAYQGKTWFMSLNNNPTLFSPDRGQDFVRQKTKDLTKVTSEKKLDSIKMNIGCLKTAYQSSLVTIPAPVSAPAETEVPASAVMLWGAVAVFAVVAFGGAKVLIFR